MPGGGKMSFQSIRERHHTSPQSLLYGRLLFDPILYSVRKGHHLIQAHLCMDTLTRIGTSHVCVFSVRSVDGFERQNIQIVHELFGISYRFELAHYDASFTTQCNANSFWLLATDYWLLATPYDWINTNNNNKFERNFHYYESLEFHGIYGIF